jgi:hypothetical protein
MKEVVIIGHSIARSVGAGGANDGDDIETVKTLLNGIPADRAGTFGSLNVADVSTSGDEFDRMVDAIKIFQQFHLSSFFAPDGRVEPERRTIRKLREEFFKNPPKPPPDKKTVVIRPQELLGGFSTERLSKFGGTDDWTGIDLEVPIFQMVPQGKSRTLLILTTAPDPELGVQNDDPSIADMTATDTSIKLTGLKPGTCNLTVVSHRELVDNVKVVVRRAIPLTVNMHFLGDPAKGKGALPGGGAALIDRLNRVFTPQTNVTFVLAPERSLSTINGKGIDFDKPIFVDPTNGLPVDATKQWFRGNEFDSSSINLGSELNVFVCHRLSIPGQPTKTGVAFPIGGRRCWFDNKVLTELGQGITLAGHEIGHSLGYHHIQVGIKALMRPTVGPNDVFIPSETLEELVVS